MLLGRMLLHDPAHLYDQAAQMRVRLAILGPGRFVGHSGGVLRLSSPPWLGFLTFIPQEAGVTWGGILWSLLQLASLITGLALLARDRTIALYAAAGIPTWMMLANANPVGLVLLGLALCWRLQERHPWLAGLALGLALVRPNVLIPLPLAFVVTRSWRALGGSAIAMIGLVASAELVHPGLTLSWMAAVLSQAGHIGHDLSPAGIGWVLGPHLGWLFAAAGLVAGLWLTRGRGPGIFTACLLASPHALVQSLVLVAAGLTAACQVRARELALLNGGALMLVMVQRDQLIVALLGSALLVAFTMMLVRRQPAAPVREVSLSVPLTRELAAAPAA
jgi:hypothetical protein